MFWAAIISWREDVRRKAEFERAMRAHGESLLRVAKVYAAGAMREDLEQEIALGVWEALPGWEQSASLKTFLFRVAHNRCIDVMRKVRPETPSTEHVERQVTSAASPASQAESRQLLGEVEACVRGLPVAQRQAFTLSLEGLSYEEIAQVLGVEANHVGVLVHRARAAVRASLEEERR